MGGNAADIGYTISTAVDEVKREILDDVKNLIRKEFEIGFGRFKMPEYPMPVMAELESIGDPFRDFALVTVVVSENNMELQSKINSVIGSEVQNGYYLDSVIPFPNNTRFWVVLIVLRKPSK